MIEKQEWFDYLPIELHQFHEDHFDLMLKSKGSDSKHQAWVGGYAEHISQCLIVADLLYDSISIECDLCKFFELESALKVLYFHDIEKLWKYSVGLPPNFNKDEFLFIELAHKYNIHFTDDEKNAIKYIHGEGDDYCDKRVMNELAAFCHSVDIMSARIFHSERL